MPDRTFYGGDNPADVIGGIGDVGGPRHYTGDRLPEGPWKCPACKADQVGPLAEGCTSCGSGTAKGYHAPTIGQPPPMTRPVTPPPQTDPRRQTIYETAIAWIAENPDATLVDAFIAGAAYQQGKTMGAPPVSVDVPTRAPAGKPRRTIIAALQLFREQILPRATEEVASGEWCAIDEVDALIQQLQVEEERS
jgi:hypothetical protein